MSYHWPGDPARPALALHCSMGASSYWGPIAQRLDGIVDLAAFDAPGHGRSPAWDGHDLHGQVLRMAEAAVGDGPVDLIGHSLGATVALRLAVEGPQRVRSLTLVEPVLFAAAPQHPQRAFAAMAEAVAAGDSRAATAIFLGEWGEQPLEALPPAVQARLVAQLPAVIETNAILVEDRARILRPGGLEAMGAPVMIIRGDRSPPVIEAIADALAARLPDVARAVVPGAAHMAPITHPDEVAGLIRVNLERA